MELFDFSNCQLRKTSIEKYTLEIVSPWAALRPSIYYIYLIFEKNEDYWQWYCALQSICALTQPTFHEEQYIQVFSILFLFLFNIFIIIYLFYIFLLFRSELPRQNLIYRSRRWGKELRELVSRSAKH